MPAGRDFLTELIEDSRMRTKPLVLSRLLSGDVDPLHSAEDRLAAAMGLRIERRLGPASPQAEG